MKTMLAGLLVTAATFALGGQADAKGCIKGAVVGGIAGHMAGNHGMAGAAAGCAIGHHHAAKMDKQQDATPDAGAADKK